MPTPRNGIAGMEFASDSSSGDEDYLPNAFLARRSPRAEMEAQGDSDIGNWSDSDNSFQRMDSEGSEDMEVQPPREGAGENGVENEMRTEMNSAPVAGFRTRVNSDGEEVFEFASDSEDISSSEDEDYGGHLREAMGVESTVEHALPDRIIVSIANRIRQRQRPRDSARDFDDQVPTRQNPVQEPTAGPSQSSRRLTGPRTRTRRKPTKKRRKGRAKKKTPKKLKAKAPPKPLGPLVIQEDWNGNEDYKAYFKKINSRTAKFTRVAINIRDDADSNYISKRRSSTKLDECIDKTETETNPDFKNSEDCEHDLSSSQKLEHMEEPVISGYKIAQLQLDRCSTHVWKWRNKSELLKDYPGVTDLILHVSAEPGATILHMKARRIVKGDAIAERIGPPLQLSKRNSGRELVYDVTEHFFFHVDPVGVPLDLLNVRGLGNRKTFSLDFNSFDIDRQCFIIDIVLLDSAIIGAHDVHEIPSGKSAALQDVFANLLGISPPPNPLDFETKHNEDIEWFYGQVKKYHTLEGIPESDIPLQPSSLKPTLRQYQRDAVNWMLYREGCLDHCVAHSSRSYINRVDLISSFLNKMYVPIELIKHIPDNGQAENTSVETRQAFYNPFSSYVCWSKPVIPPLPSGGILCDEMGLGKTVETLCLILLNQKQFPQDVAAAFQELEQRRNRKEMDLKEDVFEEDINSSDSEESMEFNDSSSESSDSSFKGRKRKKRSSNSKRKKSKKIVCRVKGQSKRTSGRAHARKRRAGSPCEFFTETNEENANNEQNKIEDSSHCSSLYRRRTPSPPNITLKQVFEAELKSNAKEAKKQNKKPKTFDALKVLYDQALNDYRYAERAKSTPKFHGKFYESYLEPRASFECICGGCKDDADAVVTCSICNSSQHADCVQFDVSLQKFFHKRGKQYLCPHCESLEPPLEAKSTLIITPYSISHQWIKEIVRHVQKNGLSILFYKGVSAHGYFPPAKLACYDIVITTYNVLSSELDYTDLPHCNSADGRRFRNPKRFLTTPSPLPSVLWWRVCLDEAQMVEGISTKMSMMAMKFEAVHRWCVTGTPMNKGLQDLFGLFVFLRVYPISYDVWWNVLVRDAFLLKDTSLLYELFGQLIWRNGKRDVLDQLGIPPQTEIQHWLSFSPVETHFYKQQFEIGSQRIMEKINRLKLLRPDIDILSCKLSSLDRATLQGLLSPFLELRQACCHPQMVKGQLISLQKGTLSMEEILDNLIKKTRLQCHEDHRLIIAALNGMAGLLIILDKYKEAAEKYRQALQSAEYHKEHFQTDSLQLLHTMENLAEILDANHDGIPFTLRDHTLRNDAADVRAKYMKKYADAVKAAQNVVRPLSEAVEEAYEQFTMRKKTWWSSTLEIAERLGKDQDLVHNLKQDIADVMKKNLKNTNSMANKFSDIYGLQRALNPPLMEMQRLRDDVLENLQELQSDDTSTMVEAAIRCHLRQKSSSYYNDSGMEENKCKLCAYHDNFLFYESVLFKTDTKNKIDRMGRNYQKTKLLGELGDDLSEEAKGEFLRQQEAEDFKATTEHVNMINDELRRGTWGDSETEVILKGIHRFAKTNRLSSEIIENGGTQMKVFEATKKEFRYLRILWRQIYDEVSARDELSQATTRLMALRGQHDQEQPSSSSARHIKQLKSGIEERTLKIQNIHVIGFHEVDTKLAQMEADYTMGNESLSTHLGQLLYLKSLEKDGYGKKGAVNTDECPICQNQLGKEWSVLFCGHSLCLVCVKKLCPNALHSFLCPLCRKSMKFADVSFVDATDDDRPTSSPALGEETSKKVIEVKGSLSTKVESIVRTLLELQETHPGEKCIIFSTWANVLDIIEGALKQNDIKYCLMNQSGGKAFNLNLDRFKEREDLQVLLMPLTSGAKGLNIIEATHVLLVEPILNLASELQAVGRVHRIGQTKPTFVHRFYIKNTIEEKLFQILKSQDISSDEEGCLTVNDLKALVSSSSSAGLATATGSSPVSPATTSIDLTNDNESNELV